jgi:hypothetical protein
MRKEVLLKAISLTTLGGSDVSVGESKILASVSNSKNEASGRSLFTGHCIDSVLVGAVLRLSRGNEGLDFVLGGLGLLNISSGFSGSVFTDNSGVCAFNVDLLIRSSDECRRVGDEILLLLACVLGLAERAGGECEYCE